MPFPVNDVAAYLQAKDLGIVDTNIFEGFMPEYPDEAIAVYETGGLGSEQGFGADGIQFDNPGIQIVFRGAVDDYETPRINAQTAQYELAKVQAGVEMGSTAYLWVNIQQAPFELKRDSSRRVYFVLNIICQKEIGAGGSTGTTYAASFTKTNEEYLVVAGDSGLATGDNQISLLAWVNIKSLVHGDVMTRWGGAAWEDNEYILQYSAGDSFYLYVSDGIGMSYLGAGVSILTDTWYLVHAYHDSVNDKLGISVNTGSPNEIAHSTGIPAASNTQLVLGGRQYQYNYLDGRIAYAAIWKGRILSSDNISEFHSLGPTIRYSDLSAGQKNGLLVWYDLEEDEGETRVDAHGTRDLTDINTVQRETVSYP